jgi:hypothetical protein
MSRKKPNKVEIRLRTIIEIGLVCLIVYAAVHIGPAVKLRIDFVNAMEFAANSPIGTTEGEIKMNLIAKAENIGIAILSDNLHVMRDTNERKTVITAYYDIHISFLPRLTYVWHIRDQVEAYLL